MFNVYEVCLRSFFLSIERASVWDSVFVNGVCSVHLIGMFGCAEGAGAVVFSFVHGGVGI